VQVERKRFLSQREGAEREARTRQQVSLADANLHERTQRAARSAELQHARQKLRNKREFVRQYDERLDSLRRDHEQVRRPRPPKWARLPHCCSVACISCGTQDVHVLHAWFCCCIQPWGLLRAPCLSRAALLCLCPCM